MQPTFEQKAVQRGADFLDKHKPGWYKKVRTPVTGSVMTSGVYNNAGDYQTGCVACQVVGNDYSIALRELGVRSRLFGRSPDPKFEAEHDEVGLGFMARDDEPKLWDDLGTAWTEQIECRLEEDRKEIKCHD